MIQYTLSDVSAFMTNRTINVIVVDWAVAASEIAYALEAVPAIGENVVQLLKLLVQYSKVSVAKLHLVGFDAGAHVVGCVGRGYKDKPIARITGTYIISYVKSNSNLTKIWRF